MQHNESQRYNSMDAAILGDDYPAFHETYEGKLSCALQRADATLLREVTDNYCGTYPSSFLYNAFTIFTESPDDPRAVRDKNWYDRRRECVNILYEWYKTNRLTAVSRMDSWALERLFAIPKNDTFGHTLAMVVIDLALDLASM